MNKSIVDGCFSFYLYQCGIRFYLKNRNIFQWRTSFCQFLKMASSGLRKMLTLINSNTWWCMSVGVSCNFMDIVVCSNHITMADSVTICYIGRCCALITADIVANLWCCMWQMVSHRGRHYNLYAEQSGRCYCHGGRWNGHLGCIYSIYFEFWGVKQTPSHRGPRTTACPWTQVSCCPKVSAHGKYITVVEQASQYLNWGHRNCELRWRLLWRRPTPQTYQFQGRTAGTNRDERW